jgi:nitrite reductase/ring-hydroxylating ferredoxin subunit
MADFVKAARTTEIEPGQARLVEVKGKQIALFNVDSQFFALDNTCTHRGGPLADGEVTCPHGATFDVRTGEVVGPPGPASRCAIRRSRDGNRHRGRGVGAAAEPGEKERN